MAKKNVEQRGRTNAETPATSDDRKRTDKALQSAARWLKRRGARREKRETRQAYNAAATLILNRLHR